MDVLQIFDECPGDILCVREILNVCPGDISYFSWIYFTALMEILRRFTEDI